MDPFVLVCPHAGALVPEDYTYLFQGQEHVLATHRALDIGALDLTLHLKSRFEVILGYLERSRLIHEPNRIRHGEHYSEFSSELPAKEKALLEADHKTNFLDPYDLAIRIGLRHGPFMAFEPHTCTPEPVNGVPRDMDVGVLFDPTSPLEVLLAEVMLDELGEEFNAKPNVPYRGDQEVIITHFRRKYRHAGYAGLAFEWNQGLAVNGEFPKQVKDASERALRAASGYLSAVRKAA